MTVKEIAHQEGEIEDYKKLRRNLNDIVKKIKKDINQDHKKFKEAEHADQSIIDLNKEYLTKISGTEKLIEELEKDQEKFKKTMEDLTEEQQLFVGKLVTKGLEDKTIQAEIMKATTERANAEETIKKFQHEVTMWNEELKFLSTIREKMARTAS